MLQVYNTLTRKKGIFKPLKEGEVSIYACGPTVYNMPHIGNYRTFLMSDNIVRTTGIPRVQGKTCNEYY